MAISSEAPFDEDDQEDSSSPPDPSSRKGGSKPPRPKVKKKRGIRGRKSTITESFWQELRGLYESGDYSQRELATYAAARGINLSQSLVASKACNQGWVKGSRAQDIRDEVHKQLKDQVGAGISKMLETHRGQSLALQAEGMHHLRFAAEQRKTDPAYLIPAALYRQIVSALNESQVMEARAMGFDIRSGRPFQGPENEARETPQELTVKVMTADDARRIQEQMEKQAASGDEGE